MIDQSKAATRLLGGNNDVLSRYRSLQSDHTCAGRFIGEFGKPGKSRKSTLELCRTALVRQLANVEAMLKEDV